MTLLEVGRITKAHGVRGDVLVALSSERTERLDPGSVLTTDRGPLTVVSSSRHQDRWIVRFDGIDGRDQADAWRGTVLRAEAIEADADDALGRHDHAPRLPVVDARIPFPGSGHQLEFEHAMGDALDSIGWSRTR